VNFCAAQIRNHELDKTIAKVLAETGLPPERLEIEVPEGLFLEPSPGVMETLTRIKALGVRVAMDDFGGGFSGLASLASSPSIRSKSTEALSPTLPRTRTLRRSWLHRGARAFDQRRHHRRGRRN
jgi:EAL domain-containing protein (putative c-di-GMP-specific phosphodiesterase class I)